MHQPSPQLPRRTWLISGLAGVGTAALATHAEAATAAVRYPPGPLTAQTTEGPYYIDPGLQRADITEGLPGIPLDVAFTVCDAAGLPLPGLRVDIWHCDAQGLYSGFAHQGAMGRLDLHGKTFLRGSQTTGARGELVFHSLYPGWYQGRTTHIHFKVINPVGGTRTNLTSQFFLPDALSEFLYTQQSDYQRQQLRDTLNANDGIALQAGDTVQGQVRESKGRYVVSLLVRVDPRANPSIDRPPAFEGGPPTGGGPGSGPPPGGPPPGFGGPSFASDAERQQTLVPKPLASKR